MTEVTGLPENQITEIEGSVEDIVYRNDSNGYSVLMLNCSGELLTAVGKMTDVSVGDDLRLIGGMKVNPNYGEQFSFEYYEQKMPSTASAILKYLSSHTVKGIGARTAEKIVDTFGENTLEIMQKQPERLTEIKGISEEKALSIGEQIRKIFGMKEIMMYLTKYRISALEAVRIWKAYGDGAIAAIENDPYILCGETIRVSFEKADKIAEHLGMAIDSPCRLKAGILYIVTDKLIDISADFLKTDRENTASATAELIDASALICDEINGRSFVFLPAFYRAEFYSADRISLILKVPPERLAGTEYAVEEFERVNNIEYAQQQRKAIIEAMSGGLLILTGGPGTGKTTTLNAIIKLYENFGLKVLLAAPTGRAAQRMSQLTGHEAKTIHRLLEVEWDSDERPRFSKNERNLLDCDVLVLDEMSMVDVMLFESVLRALPLGCRLVMVGDSDQLPSVGAGNVLGDLIDAGKIPVVRLTEIFRQSMESLIITNAHKIVHGEMPEIRRTDGDFFFMEEHDRDRISDKIVALCTHRLPAAYGYDPMNDIQVLCPGKKGVLGAVELNKKLQDSLNPPGIGKPEIKTPLYTLRVGDKVMQTRNNYDLSWVRDDGSEGSGIYNGDIGIIENIDKSSGAAKIRFDDKIVSYNSDNLISVELAYAVTVHKSQGSEFKAVVMPMYYGAPQLYYRNLLYTAVTRAKEKLILTGNVSTLKKMVDNNKKTKRYSGLRAFLERS